MKRTTRRDFLKTSMAAAMALDLPRIVMGDEPSANDTVRLAVIGMGATKAVGGVGGRGHQLLNRLRDVPGAKVVALCDVDETFLEREAKLFTDLGQEVARYGDLRRVFDDKSIDAVVIALPNHWHALATIWACQAGKAARWLPQRANMGAWSRWGRRIVPVRFCARSSTSFTAANWAQFVLPTRWSIVRAAVLAKSPKRRLCRRQ